MRPWAYAVGLALALLVFLPELADAISGVRPGRGHEAALVNLVLTTLLILAAGLWTGVAISFVYARRHRRLHEGNS